MKPVCVKCHRFYRPKKNGKYFVEGKPANGAKRPRPGLAEPDKWVPYKLWVGDLWECPDCKAEIIVGVSFAPVDADFTKTFTKSIEDFDAKLQVNDC
jgi:hypothetical protein